LIATNLILVAGQLAEVVVTMVYQDSFLETLPASVMGHVLCASPNSEP
jgi:hypothetical protein